MNRKTSLIFCTTSLISILALYGCSKSNIVETASPAPTPKIAWNDFKDSQASGYQTECKNAFADASTKFSIIEDVTNTPKDAEFLDQINRLDIVLDKALGTASLYRNVHPNAEVRSAADECQQKFADLISNISLSQPLYQKLAKVNTKKLDSITAKYVAEILLDLKRSGVNLDRESRERIKALNEEILLIGQTFNKNIRQSQREIKISSAAELKGLPQDYIDSHPPGADGKITITTAYPDYFPIMQYAENDELRKNLYIQFRKRGYPDNEDVLKELLTKRQELAKILGYDTYAAYSMEDLMIETPKNAAEFIDKINVLAKPRAEKEYKDLLSHLQKIDPKVTAVGDWQKTYLEELVKNEKYSVDSQAIRQYFRYNNVKTGIFNLTETMFGVAIQPWETEKWHDSVESYKMTEGDKLIGYFYLDMHPREGKYNHAAAFGIQDGVKDIQPPISALVCNFPGGDGEPGYMEHSQVETFLHEFGHLLHGLFGGHNKWLYFSGIKTERDFVEAPSQMLEEWVWDADTLKTFAKNDKGEAIPDELIKKMNAGRDFGRGLWTRHQMFYAALSLNYYTQDPATLDLNEVAKTLQNKYSPFAYVPDTYFQDSFGHLDGYSSNYYTYMWSLVIASDMFQKFKQEGLRNPAVAQHYRNKVLAPGGSKPAAQLVEDFLGRPYSFESFAQSLNEAE